jgi:hypothetical protein
LGGHYQENSYDIHQGYIIFWLDNKNILSIDNPILIYKSILEPVMDMLNHIDTQADKNLSDDTHIINNFHQYFAHQYTNESMSQLDNTYII